MPIAPRFQRLLYSILIKRATEGILNCNDRWLGSSAVVFSPHFDDETLGCGGTIIRKIAAGARVQLVFMTDGSTSHRHLMSGEQLREIRSSEGRAAARCLGIQPENVFLLDIAEGRLEQHSPAAGSKVRDVLEAFSPEEVYVPHRKEPLLWSADHIATHQVVMRELHKAGKAVTIWEYPIWYWFHWPWVDIDFRQKQYAKIILKNTFDYIGGFRAAADLNIGVPIEAELEHKMEALRFHKSQMTQLLPDNRWTTLCDVGGGDFLRLFFRGFEFFRRTQIV